MSEPMQTPTAAAALPYVYPLDEFYARAGLPLPKIERVGAEWDERLEALRDHLSSEP